MIASPSGRGGRRKPDGEGNLPDKSKFETQKPNPNNIKSRFGLVVPKRQRERLLIWSVQIKAFLSPLPEKFLRGCGGAFLKKLPHKKEGEEQSSSPRIVRLKRDSIEH